MSIFDQIKNSDPELKEVRLTEEWSAYCTDINEMIEALQSNTVIEFIRLDRDFVPSLEPEAAKGFFKALGSLPALKEAQIWHACIHASILADLFTSAKLLEVVKLGCLDLEGDADDFVAVSEALKGHSNLQSFTMHDFSLSDNAIVVDGLVETLATVPNLTSVKLEVSNSRRRSVVGSAAAAEKVVVALSGNALATLCRSPVLEELYLNRLQLNLDDYAVLAEAIKESPCLKVLSLPHCNLDDEACVSLAESIGQSKTLQKIDLSCNKLTDEGCITLASALKGNESVSFLRLWGNVKISNAGFDSVREMLEQNCTLERVPLMAPIGYTETRINPNQNQKKAHAA